MFWRRERPELPKYLVLIDAMLIQLCDLREALPLKFTDKRTKRALSTVQGILSNARLRMTPVVLPDLNENLEERSS